jgi:hypothetical protein
MKTRLVYHLFLAAALGTAVFAQPPAHLSQALQLVDEITAAQAVGVFADGTGTPLNRYGGSWNSPTDASYIRFADLGAGVLPGNNTKCSPLVTHLLLGAYGRDWRQFSFFDPILQTTKSVASPAPYQYIVLTKDGKGLTRIPRLDQAAPGDLLHWWQVGTTDADHSMIIVAINWASAKAYPTNQAFSDPTLAGTTYYEVEVVDSSSGVHTDDSRLVTVNGVETQVAGIGTGIIGLLVNASMEIVGYTWSLPTSDYVTKRSGWLSGLHSRLRRLPAYEAVISRHQP